MTNRDLGITKVNVKGGGSFLRIADGLSSGYTGIAKFLWHEIYPEEMRQYDRKPCIVLGHGPRPEQGHYNTATVLFNDGKINDSVHMLTLRLYTT
jgi:hypothetical protein